MKSARRHELQTNELANLLGRWMTQSQPYALAVLIIIAVVLVGTGVFTYISSSARRASGEAWRSLFLAMSGTDTKNIQEGLGRVSTNLGGGSPVALWALVVAGDLDLRNGLSSLFTNKSDAITHLGNAADKYEEVLRQLGDDTSQPLLRQRALFGLAQAKEGLGEVEEAVKYYKKAADITNADSALAEQAKQRVDALSDPDLKNWYFWFKRQEPKPPNAERPATRLPGTLPGLDSLSDFPDLGTPSGETTEPTPDKKQETGGEDQPQKKATGNQGDRDEPAGKAKSGGTETPKKETPSQ